MIHSVLSRTSTTDIRLYALLCAAIFYGALGSPTPDTPGGVEIIIAICLLFAIGLRNPLTLIQLQTPKPLYISTGLMLALYALTIGLIFAALEGHQSPNILRDIIPFSFLLLPLLLQDLTQHKHSHQIFSACALIIGLLFSVRALLSPLTVGMIATTQSGELLYLANMPTLLFSAIFLMAFGAQKLLHRLSLRHISIALIMMSLALLPLTAMVFSVQRASIGAFIIALIILLSLTIIKTPTKALRLIIPLVIITLYTMPFFSVFGTIIVEKTARVGGNMRVEELSAIWQSISASPFTIIFGHGWGASFSSPAVGNIDVTFSHSLLSSSLLKLGLLGLILTIFYLWSFVQTGWQLLHKNPVFALAITMPILIDTFLYASFKSFDFGLILCLVLLSSKNQILIREKTKSWIKDYV